MSESTETPKKKSPTTSRAKTKTAVDKSSQATVAVPKGNGDDLASPASAKAKKATAKAVESGQSAGVSAPPKLSGTRKSAATGAPSAGTAGKKKAAGAPSRSAQLPDQEAIDRMVAEAAYYLAEKRNFATGFEEEDWNAAKEQIMTQLQDAKKPAG